MGEDEDDYETPERDLAKLLRGMAPVLDDREFVFVSVDKVGPEVFEHDPVCLFREEEGWTLIIDAKKAALYGAEEHIRFSMITLTIQSDLESVGLTAAAATALAAYGIPGNVVAGYYHDHIFTPEECAEDAVDALLELSELAGGWDDDEREEWIQ